MPGLQLSSEFLNRLASPPADELDEQQSAHLPSLTLLSKELGVSVAILREQLEVAEAFGLVEVRPRTGIRRLPYSFAPAVQQSLAYAIALDGNNFDAFADLRNRIEASYWYDAVQQLTSEDHEKLNQLIRRAWNKLLGNPVQIPHEEHRQLHLCIFRRLDNPFVLGILNAYWEVYEAVGLNVYTDFEYLKHVWDYHQRMVDAICSNDFEAGYHSLVEHNNLLYLRLSPSSETIQNPREKS
jgi:DNA-binding FadR family transcriptional regulator